MRFVQSSTMEGSFQLNPYASPFIPASRTVFVENFKEDKASKKHVGGTEENETADKSAGYQLPSSFSSDDCVQSLGKLNISDESSSKGDPAGSGVDPSQHEEGEMDPLVVVESVSLMFPDVSSDFIVEALKAHEFDINLTINMLHDLLGEDHDYGYPAETPNSSRSSNLNAAWQEDQPTWASDAN